MNPADARKSKPIELAILFAITVAAAALRFHALATCSFWFDEGISVEIARLNWASFAKVLWEREANMSLYYFLLRIWLWFGGSEFFVRALSALIGTAAVPLIYALGRRLFNARAGLFAASLLAVNAYDVRYSQEARGYALAVFMALLSALLFAEFVRSGGERRGMAWAAASALLVYCHFYGALIVPAQIISLLLAKPPEFDWKNIYRPGRWFVYLTFPLLAFVVVHGSSQLNWIPRISLDGIFGTFNLYAGARGWPLELLFAVAAIFAAWAWRESWRISRSSFDTWANGFIWLWLALPVVFVVMISLWRNFFLARYLIACLPALILIAAAGVSRIRILPIQLLALAGFAVLSVQGVLRYYAEDIDIFRDDWRSASQFLLASARPDDGVIFYPGPGRMPYEFYKSVERPIAPPRVISPAHAPGQSAAVTDQDFLVRPLAEVIESLPEDAPRVWLVADSPNDLFDESRSVLFLRNWCETRYRQMEMRKFAGIEIILYSK